MLENRDVTADMPLLHNACSAIDRLARHNLLYGLSALLMLVGCYLVVMPYLFEYRDLGGILTLLLVTNIYETMVIVTLGLLLRRAPDSREAPLLLFVEMIFLLDATMTVNACIPLSLRYGTGIALICLALAVFKLYAISLLAGRPVLAGLHRYLIPAIALVHVLQIPAALAITSGKATSIAAGAAMWSAVGGFGLYASFLLGRTLHWQSDKEGQPFWETSSGKLIIVALGLAMITFHALGASFIHRTGISILMLAPFWFAVMALEPLYFHNAHAWKRDAGRAVLTLLLFAPRFHIDRVELFTMFGTTWTLWRIAVLFGSLTAFLIWQREKRSSLLVMALVLLGLGVLGHDYDAARNALIVPRLFSFLFVIGLGAVWFVLKPSRVNFFLGMVPAMILSGLYASYYSGASATVETVRLFLLAAYLVSLTGDTSRRFFALGLGSAASLLGLAGLSAGGSLGIWYFWVLLVPMIADVFLSGGWHAFLPACYLLIAMPTSGLVGIPKSLQQWGAAIIALAFVVFVGGILLTKRNLRQKPSQEGEAKVAEITEAVKASDHSEDECFQSPDD